MQFFINLDISTFFLLNSLAGHSPSTDFIIVFLADYLSFILPIIFLVLLYRSASSLREKFWILSVVSFSAFFARFGVTSLIRFFYHRPRPFLLYDVQPLFNEVSYSFPSGHATFFFAFAFAIYLYNKKWGVWFFIATLFMTTARVIAGVHYPSDVLGGMLIGIVVAYLIFRYLGNSFGKIIKCQNPFLV